MRRLISRLRLRLTVLLRPGYDRELGEEIDSHLRLLENEYRASGMSPEDARRAARRQFGNATAIRQASRDLFAFRVLDQLRRDLRLALRSLGRSPGFALAAVLTLALGIGATTSVFSVADPLLTRPLPVRDPGDLVLFRTVDPYEPDGRDRVPQELFEKLREGSTTLSAVFGSYGFEPFVRNMTAEGEGADGRPVRVEPVTGGYFSGLGVNAVLGRAVTESDDRAEAPLVAVISYGLWRGFFGGGPDVIGRTIRLEHPVTPERSTQSATIVGVAPAGFNGADIDRRPEVWLPLEPFRRLTPQSVSDEQLAAFRASGIRMMARPRPGVDIEAIQAEVDLLAGQLTDRTLAIANSGEPNVHVEPGGRGYSELRLEFSEPILVLGIAVALVLLIVCANVAALMLTRGASRRSEMAVRIALGSGRAGLVRQFLAEGVVLALAGGVLGLFAARSGTRVLAGYMPSDSAFASGLDLDGRTLLFLASVSLLSMIVFALLPGVHASRLAAGPAARESRGRWEQPGSRLSVYRIIVIGQVALTLLLLVGAGLFLRTLQNLRTAEIGFDERNVIEFAIESPSGSRGAEFAQDGLARLGALPGVRSTSFYGTYGLLGDESMAEREIWAVGRVDPLVSHVVPVGSRFFETMGIPLMSGNAFPEVVDTWGTPSPDTSGIILSESLAAALFGNENAVGGRIRMRIPGSSSELLPGPPGSNPSDREAEVVGVAGDVKHASLREQSPWTIYMHAPLVTLPSNRFAVRTEGDAAALLPTVRRLVEEFDSSFRVTGIHTLAEVRDASIASERFVAQLAGFFGLTALVLASIGIYGVVSYAVTQRRGEIGIRMALGARIRRVVGMFLRETTWMLAAGVALGLGASMLATRAVSSLLFGVTPLDPATIVLGAVILVLAAVFAAYVPARRASRIDPMAALRHE